MLFFRLCMMPSKVGTVFLSAMSFSLQKNRYLCKVNKMIRLSLPSYDIKLRGIDRRPQVLDSLRRRWVALTPEEWVRQHFIHWLTVDLGYPAALLANEVQLHIGHKTLRADSVLYDRQLQPRMIIEYKAPHVEITQQVFDQVLTYNLQLQAPYLVVSNGIHHYCCRWDLNGKKYLFLDQIPYYEDL